MDENHANTNKFKRSWSVEEKRILTNVADQYIGKPVGKEVLTLLQIDINEIQKKEGSLPMKSFALVSSYFYSIRKKLEKRNDLNPSFYQKQSICDALKTLKEHFNFLEEENNSLKKEIRELKEQLRALKEIRQSVENYQKTIR